MARIYEYQGEALLSNAGMMILRGEVATKASHIIIIRSKIFVL
jgi:hypothetical protein